LKQFYKFLATGFDSGYIPGAPGTYGTALAAGLYLALYQMPLISYLLFCVAFTFFAYWVTRGALPHFEGDDPSCIVIDEMAGMFITMIGHPFSWVNLGLGFILFRIFDITKPPPIRYVDRHMKGAWGITLDDVIAGIFACAALWVIRYFFKL
jgi:phosphatidylglycerophosphatase A